MLTRLLGEIPCPAVKALVRNPADVDLIAVPPKPPKRIIVRTGGVKDDMVMRSATTVAKLRHIDVPQIRSCRTPLGAQPPDESFKDLFGGVAAGREASVRLSKRNHQITGVKVSRDCRLELLKTLVQVDSLPGAGGDKLLRRPGTLRLDVCNHRVLDGAAVSAGRDDLASLLSHPRSPAAARRLTQA